jgi:type IV secretion system protein VirB9
MTALNVGAILVVAGSWLHTTIAHAQAPSEQAVADGRIRVAAYNPDEVYRLRGFAGYQIDLEFEPGESFTGLGAGDIEALSFAGQDNHLFLKPRAARVATNLTVLTTRRHYQFDYSATAQPPGTDASDVTYVLRFTYPPDPSRTAEVAAGNRVDAQLTAAAAVRPTNIDYWYCGAPSLRPTVASDDGVHTRLRFGAHAELPAIFVRNDDGSDSLLNFSMDGGDVIVHRVARRLIVRRGKLIGCIVNQGFAGGGTRLDSGTVAPDVQRIRPGTTR